jgi:hypothetical protein
MDLKLNPIRRQCFVPGCRNLDCFIPMRSREMPQAVVLCRDCIRAIYEGVYPPEAEDVNPETETGKGEEIAVEDKPKTSRKKA